MEERGWWKGENNVDIKGHIILVTNSYWLQGWGLKGLEGVGHNEDEGKADVSWYGVSPLTLWLNQVEYYGS